jgi:hypothetical protein
MGGSSEGSLDVQCRGGARLTSAVLVTAARVRFGITVKGRVWAAESDRRRSLANPRHLVEDGNGNGQEISP